MKTLKVWLSMFLGKNARNGFSKCVLQLQGENKILIKEKSLIENKIASMKMESDGYSTQIESNAKIAEAVKKIADALN